MDPATHRPHSAQARLVTCFALVLASVGLAASATLGSAQEAATAPVDPHAAFEPFFGAYHATDMAAQSSAIENAILTGTEAMGPLRRSVGRRRLRAVNVPVRVLRILHEGGNVVTEFDGDRYVAPISGVAQRGRDPEGEPVRVSYRVAGTSLQARYVGDDGEKRIAFSLGESGRMTLSITLLSDQLPGPIRYRIAYRRQ